MLKIYTDKKKILRTKCQEIENITTKDINLVKEMIEFLKLSQDDEYAKKNHIEPGIGLAAPQIGVPSRFFAIYLVDGEKTYEFGLINPVIERTSVKQVYLSTGEGCLSVPQKHDGYVMRYYKVVISGFEVLSNQKQTYTLYGYPAIAVQHEMDHLDGVLYYDHIDKNNPFNVAPGAKPIY
ncbi:MAG: peptide deformylase [Bacilli bacterium]|nr:peptide deformylase [Bacilli bacterium]